MHTVFVIVGEVDLIAKQDDPLSQLDGRHDHPVWRPTVLAVMVERLQEQLWGRGTREVEPHNLHRRENRVIVRGKNYNCLLYRLASASRQELSVRVVATPQKKPKRRACVLFPGLASQKKSHELLNFHQLTGSRRKA